MRQVPQLLQSKLSMADLRAYILVLLVISGLYQGSDQLIPEKCGEDCTPGWDCHFNSYYKYIPNAKSWTDAEFYCQKLYPGAHLASIHSEDENDFLTEITFKNNSNYPVVWVGGSDCYKDRSFVWTDGSQWDYQKWRQWEPSNTGGREPCIDFNFVTPGLWNDEHCDQKFPFICKYTTPCRY
ncbi:lectin-like [Pleurodeles waltl]|uniref:lectin-like n=1 Tax=Pleurodeles waltl TaxID=8319 RepID=UPI003709BC71